MGNLDLNCYDAVSVSSIVVGTCMHYMCLQDNAPCSGYVWREEYAWLSILLVGLKGQPSLFPQTSPSWVGHIQLPAVSSQTAYLSTKSQTQKSHIVLQGLKTNQSSLLQVPDSP